MDRGLIAKMLIFGDILKRIERAATNGERLHLDVVHVRALVTSSVYVALLELKAQEFASQWHVDKHPQNPQRNPQNAPGELRPASNLVSSGSGTAATETIGTSVGSKAGPYAERVSVSEAARRVIRHRQRRTP